MERKKKWKKTFDTTILVYSYRIPPNQICSCRIITSQTTRFLLLLLSIGFRGFQELVFSLLRGKKEKFNCRQNKVRTRCKIRVNLGSTHIWHIYHSINAIFMCVSEWRLEGKSIGDISIRYGHLRANKSSSGAVIIIKVIPKIVKKSDKAISWTGVFTFCWPKIW